MSEVAQRTKEDVQDIAAGLGLACMFPRDNELVLDIDMPGGDYNREVLEVLASNDFVLVTEMSTKSAGGNTHWYLRFSTKFSVLERMGLQTALGSDPKKEALSLVRCREGDPTAACAMFEKKMQAILVRNWRARWDAKYRGEL